jgi:excisionase family DNA binding protein
VIDEIAAASQPAGKPESRPKSYGGDTRRFRASVVPQSPRGPPIDDDLEERLGDKLLFSINELADLTDRSPATIFRLLRLGQLQSVQVGGVRRFTRATVLDFLRRGTSDTIRRGA